MNITNETRTVVVEREMPYPPEKVWRALTETPLLDDWLMKGDFKPVVGHKFTFHNPAAGDAWNGLIDCTVLAVDPPRRLSYTWSASAGSAALTVDTVVTLTLERTKNGTRLRMEQSGFRADQNRAYGGARYGWQNFLGELERVLGGLT